MFSLILVLYINKQNIVLLYKIEFNRPEDV
jgi:hypothetical protein